MQFLSADGTQCFVCIVVDCVFVPVQAKITATDGSGKMVATATPKVSRDALAPHVSGIVSALFGIMNTPGYPENEHLMRCVTRVVALGGAAVIPIADAILAELTKILARVRAVKGVEGRQWRVWAALPVDFHAGFACSRNENTDVCFGFGLNLEIPVCYRMC